MKNIAFILLLALSGCLEKARSTNPFYTSDLKTEWPAVLGEWDQVATTRDGSEHSVDTWLFTDHLRIYTDHGPTDFDAVFFRVGERTYCDIFDREQKFHELCVPNLRGQTLSLSWLDQNWLTNAIAKGAISIPAPQRQSANSNLVFTASTAQWLDFLRQQGTNNEAFDGGETLNKRVQNFSPRRRS